ncbi:MAG: winged helix-turn-helix domain-containing protein [Candidatus Hodarchaeales archaeon]|jgi:predicted DNA-binding transcriptional regulator
MNSKNSVAEELLKGKTLQIYWYLLSHGQSGIREIQKQLNIPSSSTVSYHMNKLVTAGLVSQNINTDKYLIKEEVKTGVLGLYVKFGGLLIPRMAFYLSFSLTFFISTLILILSRNTPLRLEDLLFLVFNSSISIIFCFEAIRTYKMKPL